jgi:hypothetical protein
VKNRLMLGGVLSVLHFLLTLGVAFSASFNLPHWFFAIQDRVLNVLILPIRLLWEMGAYDHLGEPMMWLTVVLNSGLWGFGLAGLLRLCGFHAGEDLEDGRQQR